MCYVSLRNVYFFRGLNVEHLWYNCLNLKLGPQLFSLFPPYIHTWSDAGLQYYCSTEDHVPIAQT